MNIGGPATAGSGNPRAAGASNSGKQREVVGRDMLVESRYFIGPSEEGAGLATGPVKDAKEIASYSLQAIK